MAARPQPGSPAPTFALHDQQDRPVALEDFRGKPVLLFFYPKASTPG